MYNRRNDSRMGDEVFAMGLLLAPFAWKIVKYGQAKANAKKEAFEALPKEMQEQIKYKRYVKGERIFRYLLISFVGLDVLRLVTGGFSFEDILAYIPLMIVYYMMKAGKEKYEINNQASFE